MKISTNKSNERFPINKKMVVEGMVLRRVPTFGICKIIKKIINRILTMVDRGKGILARSSQVIRIKMPIKAGATILNLTSAGLTRAKAQWWTANPRPSILTHMTEQNPCSQMIQSNIRMEKGSQQWAHQERSSRSLVGVEADSMTVMGTAVRHLRGLEGTTITNLVTIRICMTKRKALRG